MNIWVPVYSFIEFFLEQHQFGLAKNVIKNEGRPQWSSYLVCKDQRPGCIYTSEMSPSTPLEWM